MSNRKQNRNNLLEVFSEGELKMFSSEKINMIAQFRGDLFGMLRAEDRILFHYADDLFKRNRKTLAVMSRFILEFIRVFLSAGQPLTVDLKNIFLCILRIINPPKTTDEMIVTYLHNLVTSCRPDRVSSILVHYRTTAASLLIKFINERVYEETMLAYLGSHKRTFHFLNKHDYRRQVDLFLSQVNSSAFEEIVALGLEETQPVLCAIHLPKAGDIMLSSGERVEVKVNKASASSARASSCKHYILGNNTPTEHKTVREGVAVHFSFHTESTRRPLVAYLNDRAIQHFDVCLDQAVRLSGIYVPRDVSYALLDLLGLRRQGAANAYLQECISFPPLPDGMPEVRNRIDARSVIRLSRIIPAQMMLAAEPAGASAASAAPRSARGARSASAAPRSARGARSASAAHRGASAAHRSASAAHRGASAAHRGASAAHRGASATSARRNHSNRRNNKSRYSKSMKGPKAEGRKTSKKKNKGKNTKKKGKKK